MSTTLQATEVDDHAPVRSWSVEESGWKQLLPDLPDDVIALLATPVVVSAESLGGQRRPERAGRAPLFQAPPTPHVAQFLAAPAVESAALPVESLVPAPGRHRR